MEEDELLGLTPRELEKLANELIYKSEYEEKKEEYPVLKGRKIKKIRYREVPMPHEDLAKLMNGEHFDYFYLKKFQKFR